MKYILIFFVSFISLSSFGQKMTYKEWQQEAKTEIRLLPEYGNIPKSPEQKSLDKELIESELKTQGTHRKASDHLIAVGFDFLYKGDLRHAMYRFNQAWLLDPKNENVYWGFGVIYFNFNDYNEALKQLEKGLLINPNSASILTDKATIYTVYYQNSNNPDDEKKAIELFKKSYKIDPTNQNTLFKLSAVYYYRKDCSNALKYYNECMKLGGQQISPGYADALKKQCNN